MSDAGTITPETQIKELTEKLEEETDRLLKLYAAYEQQEAELRDTCLLYTSDAADEL